MRLRRDAKLDLLGNVDLLRECSKKELGQIAAISEELDFGEGHPLIREGAPGSQFFVLVDGTVKITKKGRKVAELGPGDWFGEIALITDAPRGWTVTSTSPVRMLVIERRPFAKLMHDVPSIQGKVMQSLAHRLAVATP